RRIRGERLVVVPQAEVGGDGERFLPLAPEREQQLGVRVEAEGRRDLHALTMVVVAITLSRTDGGQAGLGRRYLAVIVGVGEIVNFAADEETRSLEERPLGAERVPCGARRGFHRDVAVDERVVEAFVIEDRGAEAERGDEAVDRREKVLASAETRIELE